MRAPERPGKPSRERPEALSSGLSAPRQAFTLIELLVVIAIIVCDWYYAGRKRTARSPHLEGKLPAGGNLVFLDGHADWRPYKRMTLRTTMGSDFWY